MKCRKCGSDVYVRLIETYNWYTVEEQEKLMGTDWTLLLKYNDEGSIFLQVTCPVCGTDVQLSKEDKQRLQNFWGVDYVITTTNEIF